MAVAYTDSLVPKASATCFDDGKYKVSTKTIPESTKSDTPHPPLYMVFPTEQGSYPIILFIHGFSIPNFCYSELFKFIASHGYIIVAPGETLSGFLRGLFICSAVNDVDQAADTANWINANEGENLQLVLPLGVSPDLEKVALTGHSKGGKAAFALALALGHVQTSLQFKALIGLDPVAGSSPAHKDQPRVLNFLPKSFDIPMPVAVIGTGLSDDGCCGCVPAPAPWGCNHPFFFNESKPPSCYFVARNFGHMDMVDDWLAVLAGMFICKSGKGSKENMRKACGGIFVAFLKAYLFHDNRDLIAIFDSPKTLSPITLDPVRWTES